MNFIEAVNAIVTPGATIRRKSWSNDQFSFSMLESTLALDAPDGIGPWNFSLSISDIVADDWIIIQKIWVPGKGWMMKGGE